MKYSDYKTHSDRYQEQSKANMEAFKPCAAEMHRLSESFRRTYSLGRTLPTQYMEGCGVIITVAMWVGEPTLNLRVATAGGFFVDLHNLAELTATQIMKIAEIRRAVAQWIDGEIDELPPDEALSIPTTDDE